MGITVPPLDPDEWRTYREVRLAALRDAPEAFGGSYEASAAYPDQQWIDWCDAPSWFAFEETRPVGMVRVFPREDRGLPELLSLWVAPHARGTGVAERLIRSVLDWADDHGDAGVLLQVTTDDTRAIRLYERVGFVATGHTDHLPHGRSEIELEHRFDHRHRSPTPVRRAHGPGRSSTAPRPARRAGRRGRPRSPATVLAGS